ncbi:MAG TPA: hypothetical protein VIM90_04630, partial [Arenimonas sp.]
PASKVRWAFGSYDDGTPIPVGHRRVYRERVDLQAAYPDPFDARGQSLLYWMRHQGPIEFPEHFEKKAVG